MYSVFVKVMFRYYVERFYSTSCKGKAAVRTFSLTSLPTPTSPLFNDPYGVLANISYSFRTRKLQISVNSFTENEK